VLLLLLCIATMINSGMDYYEWSYAACPKYVCLVSKKQSVSDRAGDYDDATSCKTACV
jgi:hypothetical protein